MWPIFETWHTITFVVQEGGHNATTRRRAKASTVSRWEPIRLSRRAGLGGDGGSKQPIGVTGYFASLGHVVASAAIGRKGRARLHLNKNEGRASVAGTEVIGTGAVMLGVFRLMVRVGEGVSEVAFPKQVNGILSQLAGARHHLPGKQQGTSAHEESPIHQPSVTTATRNRNGDALSASRSVPSSSNAAQPWPQAPWPLSSPCQVN